MASVSSPRVLILALSKITADLKAVQPRIGMDMEHVKYLATMAQEHDAKYTLQVVFDGKTYWLFDGFHRHKALVSLHHMGAEYRQVRCEVTEGTKGDAVARAAQANAKTLLPLTTEDRRKAMWNLLDLGEEWRGKAPGVIAKAVGLSKTTARKYWVEYFTVRAIPIPDSAEASDGRVNPTSRRKPRSSESPRIRPRPDGRFDTSIDGKKFYFPVKSVPEASAKIQEMVDQSEATRVSYEKNASIHSRLTCFQVHCETALGIGKSNSLPGLFGSKAGNVAFTWDSFRDRAAAVAAAGRALWLREYTGLARAVVLCPVEGRPTEVLDVFRRIGVEFLTIEEFAASLKAEGEPTPSAPPTEQP